MAQHIKHSAKQKNISTNIVEALRRSPERLADFEPKGLANKRTFYVDNEGLIYHFHQNLTLPDGRALTVYFMAPDNDLEKPNSKLEISVRPTEASPVGLETRESGLKVLESFVQHVEPGKRVEIHLKDFSVPPLRKLIGYESPTSEVSFPLNRYDLAEVRKAYRLLMEQVLAIMNGGSGGLSVDLGQLAVLPTNA